jgi:hypothetical protein
MTGFGSGFGGGIIFVKETYFPFGFLISPFWKKRRNGDIVIYNYIYFKC